MKSEVKEALERWRENQRTDYANDEGITDDAFELAEAFSEEHPADDEDPVTSKWLLSVGGKSALGGTQYVIQTGTIMVLVESLAQNLGVGVARRQPNNTVAMAVTPVASGGCTRGDVRRLCSAVGCVLVEKEDSHG
tara:strand:- start:4451 stop:4858 length:408 start_codon:yes stop_codon:yes gene_type:complete